MLLHFSVFSDRQQSLPTPSSSYTFAQVDASRIAFLLFQSNPRRLFAPIPESGNGGLSVSSGLRYSPSMSIRCTGFPLRVLADTMNSTVSVKSSPESTNLPESSASAASARFSLFSATAETEASGAALPAIPITFPERYCPLSIKCLGVNGSGSYRFRVLNLLHPFVIIAGRGGAPYRIVVGNVADYGRIP